MNDKGTTPPRVLVIGASGALGALVADAFRRQGWTVIESGRSRSTSSDFRHIELGAAPVPGSALSDVDVVVNTVPDPGLAAERHVLEYGGLLINLSAGPATSLHILRAGNGPATGAVVMNAGVAPGVTNLVAATLIGQHPHADEVRLVFTVSTKGSGGPASADFAHRGLTCRTHHDVARIDLPHPFGTRPMLGFAETDAGWLGQMAEGRTVSPYICLTERPVHRTMLALNRVRLIGRLPRAMLGSGRRTTVENASREPVAHLVAVLDGGRQVAARLVRGSGDFRMAAASSVVFAHALLGLDGGPPVRPGAWFPEEVLTLERVEEGLLRSGTSITGLSSRGRVRYGRR